MEYEYDTNGTFKYFLLTMIAIILIPVTIIHMNKKEERIVTSMDCGCDQCKKKKQQLKIRKKGFEVNGMFIWIGWAFMCVLVSIIIREKKEEAGFDPFEILSVTPFSTQAAIKKRFRALSIKYHPDKVSEDNKEESQKLFMKIQSAYKALTDEDARIKWEKYGTPDGEQAAVLGIALPAAMVAKENKPIMIAVYLLIFFIFVPYLVNRWWKKTKKQGNVQNETMTIYYRELKDFFGEKKILILLSQSIEFKEVNLCGMSEKEEEEYNRIYSRVIAEYEQMFYEDYKKPKKQTEIWQHRVFIILLAHIMRIPFVHLSERKSKICRIALECLSGVAQISGVQERGTVVLNCISLSQELVQACWGEKRELLQIPYITADMLMRIQRKEKQTLTISALVGMEEDERRGIMSFMSNSQYESAMKVARAIPKVTIRLKENQVDVEREGDGEFTVVIDVTPVPSEIHAPYFYGEKTPYLWLFGTNKTTKELIGIPKRLPCIGAVFGFEFKAPASEGALTISFLIKSDTFIGCQDEATGRLNIMKPREAIEEDSDENEIVVEDGSN